MKKPLIRPATLLKIHPALRSLWSGYKIWRFSSKWSGSKPATICNVENDLLAYFNEHKEGRGIWKFIHYFEIYERHFSRFRGEDVHVLEIGVYSGGSLEMWRSYFGPSCKIYGVDLEQNCKAYESDSVKVFIGDQADRDFWKRVKQEIPTLDIVIDDGGHSPEQQTVSLEELLPHIRPGGVYLCEDIFGDFNEFSLYLCGMVQNLNRHNLQQNFDDNERREICKANHLQSAVSSVHLYPFLALIEKSREKVSEFIGSRHGTLWEPFLK